MSRVSNWFFTLIRQFFFSIDQIVFNFISDVYDLLISIARTSVLTQSDIIEMADKIYKLLAVFMIFKVTLSLITYIVNPDDFSDKSKGISKLGTNIIISLSLLILTPYIFNYAYELQTIILEDNSLANLIFETDSNNNSESDFLNSAGDKIAYIAMTGFFTPNVSITGLENCVVLNDEDGFNDACSGVTKNGSDYSADQNKEGTMAYLTKGNTKFTTTDLINYVAGVENKNLGLMFRADLVSATTEEDDGRYSYVMDYKYFFSTVVGVVIILLLLTYCMDVAVRSIKLAFLQLVAPIPILSYVDPKSGKDGMFKKWYQMCFKTYLSLFIRLLALYFAIYIIGKVDSMVDIVDGSTVTNTYIKIFIIIGALMFAKQLPKILEGLGIKLDGDGKFFLNPLKKFEEQAFGGKNITGMARGAMVGAAGMVSGAGFGRAFSGAWRGLTSGKGWKETGKAEAEMNRKMRQAKLDGSSFSGRLGAKFAGALGLPSGSEDIENRIHRIDEAIKDADNKMAPSKKLAEEKKLYADSVAAMEKRAVSKIEAGEAGVLSERYRQKQAHIESLKARLDQAARDGKSTDALEKQIALAENESRNYLNDIAMKAYLDANKTGGKINYSYKGADGKWHVESADAKDIFGVDGKGKAKTDATLDSLTAKMEAYVDTYGSHHENMVKGTASDIHSAMGKTKGEISAIEVENEKIEKQKRDLNNQKQELYEEQRRAKANESAIK